MLTNIEKAIIQILQILKIKNDTIIGIMLLLKENTKAQNKLLEFMKQSDPNNLNEKILSSKVLDLTNNQKS